jgi:hypothetical protein
MITTKFTVPTLNRQQKLVYQPSQVVSPAPQRRAVVPVPQQRRVVATPQQRTVPVQQQVAKARREVPAAIPPIQEANSLMQAIFASRDSMVRGVMQASSDASEARALATAQRNGARQAVASRPTNAPVQPKGAAQQAAAIVAVRPRYVPSIYATTTPAATIPPPASDESGEKK